MAHYLLLDHQDDFLRGLTLIFPGLPRTSSPVFSSLLAGGALKLESPSQDLSELFLMTASLALTSRILGAQLGICEKRLHLLMLDAPLSCESGLALLEQDRHSFDLNLRNWGPLSIIWVRFDYLYDFVSLRGQVKATADAHRLFKILPAFRLGRDSH